MSAYGYAGEGSSHPSSRDRGDRDRGERGERGERGRFFRKKICRFCSEKLTMLDYKESERLGKFLTEKGKIIPRRVTGVCAKHQRGLTRAIKRARHAALLPFQVE